MKRDKYYNLVVGSKFLLKVIDDSSDSKEKFVEVEIVDCRVLSNLQHAVTVKIVPPVHNHSDDCCKFKDK